MRILRAGGTKDPHWPRAQLAKRPQERSGSDLVAPTECVLRTDTGVVVVAELHVDQRVAPGTALTPALVRGDTAQQRDRQRRPGLRLVDDLVDVVVHHQQPVEPAVRAVSAEVDRRAPLTAADCTSDQAGITGQREV